MYVFIVLSGFEQFQVLVPNVVVIVIEGFAIEAFVAALGDECVHRVAPLGRHYIRNASWRQVKVYCIDQSVSRVVEENTVGRQNKIVLATLGGMSAVRLFPFQQ